MHISRSQMVPGAVRLLSRHDTQLQQARSRSAEMQGRCVKMQDRQAAADTFEAKIKSYRARAFDYDLQVHFRKRQAERQRTGRDPDVDPSLWVKKCAKKIKRYRARYFDSYLQVHVHLHGSNGGDSDLPLY